jgi:uncharacterized peroxidase-related enzyme
MSFIDDAGLSEHNHPLLGEIKSQLGYVLNFYKAQGLRPDLMEAEFKLFSLIFADGALTRKQKEYIAVAVSGDNLSTYCATRHSEFLRGMGVTDPELDQLGADHHYAAISDAEKALLDFALKMTRQPHTINPQDIETLRAHGFNDTQILEAAVAAAGMNFANRVASALGAKPESSPRKLARSAS